MLGNQKITMSDASKVIDHNLLSALAKRSCTYIHQVYVKYFVSHKMGKSNLNLQLGIIDYQQHLLGMMYYSLIPKGFYRAINTAGETAH